MHVFGKIYWENYALRGQKKKIMIFNEKRLNSEEKIAHTSGKVGESRRKIGGVDFTGYSRKNSVLGRKSGGDLGGGGPTGIDIPPPHGSIVRVIMIFCMILIGV